MRETFIILIAIVGIFGVIGYVDSIGIRDCVEMGSSKHTCEYAINR